MKEHISIDFLGKKYHGKQYFKVQLGRIQLNEWMTSNVISVKLGLMLYALIGQKSDECIKYETDVWWMWKHETQGQSIELNWELM